MRIALTHMRHKKTGGTERYLDLVAAHLAEAGHEVTIVCRSREESPHPAVRFEMLRTPAIGATWRMWAFARAVERHVAEADRYDLVFGLGLTWTQDVLRLGGGSRRTYMELAHRATGTPLERLLGWAWLKQRVKAAIERHALAPGAYRKIICNSRMVRDDIVRRYGIDPADVVVIHNGADLERFHPRHRTGAGARLRRELGWGDDERVVLFLGTGYGRKGLAPLIEGFAELRRRREAARLLVVGYDSDRPRYEKLARRLGLEEAARFLGGRRDAEVCYGAADLYALPTLYDPFANTTVEALASGLPVITTRANGGAELIEHRVQGSILEAADPRPIAAELEHWTGEGVLEAARARARELAERFGAERMVRAPAEVLEACARAGP